MCVILCVHVCVGLENSGHSCIHLLAFMCRHICVYICAQVCMCRRMLRYAYVCVCLGMCVYVCVFMCGGLSIWVCGWLSRLSFSCMCVHVVLHVCVHSRYTVIWDQAYWSVTRWYFELMMSSALARIRFIFVPMLLFLHYWLTKRHLHFTCTVSMWAVTVSSIANTGMLLHFIYSTCSVCVM